jgi:protein SCO1
MKNLTQMPKRRDALVKLLGLAGATASVFGLGSFGALRGTAKASETEASLTGSRRNLVRDGNLPNLAFMNQNGEKLRFYDDLVKDKSVVINFFYTSCSESCPIAMHNLANAKEDLAKRGHKDVAFISVTLDPDIDTPAVLKAFSKSHDTGSDWQLLTGSKADITQLRRGLGIYDINPELDKDPASHSGIAVLGNEPKAKWRSVPAVISPVRIRQAIERVLLPPTEWQNGREAVMELAYDDSSSAGSPVRAETLAQMRELVAQR